MAEVLIEYDSIVADEKGRRWSAHVCGRRGDQKMWEGWIEFVPVDPKARPVRGPRETTQPNRDDLLYWATGLTPVYLKGALERALLPPLKRSHARASKPHFASPAPSVVASPTSAPSPPHPLLDPFDVYDQGEDVLIHQLEALDTPRLRDIVLAYELMRAGEAKTATRLQLATAIVDAARSRAARANA